jgi:hypothetical protein
MPTFAGTSNDNVYLGFDEPEGGVAGEEEGGGASSPQAPLARLSDICALSSTETEKSTTTSAPAPAPAPAPTTPDHRQAICDICQDVSTVAMYAVSK